MLHMSITSLSCFYHIELLSWEKLTKKEGWVPTIIDLIYELNPISIKVSRTTLLVRPLSTGQQHSFLI